MFMEWFSIALAGGCFVAIGFLGLRALLGKKNSEISLVTRVPLKVTFGCLGFMGAAIGVYAWSQSGSEPPVQSSNGYQVHKDTYETGKGYIENDRLDIGKPAPDFHLVTVDGTEKVPLWNGVKEKPVVLIFGNFGCPYFCSRLDSIVKLQETFQDRAEFRLVYIEIQHDEPAFMQSVVADPELPASDRKNRAARIRAGMEQYGLAMNCMIDEDDNRAQNSYRAFPARLVIVDTKGQIGFDSGNIFQNGLDIAGAIKWLDDHSAQANHLPATAAGQHTGD